jgi:hypothetical protein
MAGDEYLESVGEDMMALADKFISKDIPERTRKIMVEEILDIVLMSRCPQSIIGRGPTLCEDQKDQKDQKRDECPQINSKGIDSAVCAECLEHWLLSEQQK